MGNVSSNYIKLKMAELGATEQTIHIYLKWMKQYIEFSNGVFTEKTAEDFISTVDDSKYKTQKATAATAVRYFFKEILEQRKIYPKSIQRVTTHVFNVPSLAEVSNLLTEIKKDEEENASFNNIYLIARMICALGLGPRQVCNLRICDIGKDHIKIADPKNPRALSLPNSLKQGLKQQILFSKIIYEEDFDDFLRLPKKNKKNSIMERLFLFPSSNTAKRERGCLSHQKVSIYFKDLQPDKEDKDRITPRSLRNFFIAEQFKRRCNFDDIAYVTGLSVLHLKELYSAWIKKTSDAKIKSPLDLYDL